MLDHQLSSTDEWMFTASLHECNKYMFEEELATDLIFTFPTPDGSQVQVQAHRYILISRSPVFRAMLCGLMAPKNDVKVEDVNAEAFKEILRYLYYEEVKLNEDNAFEVLYGAKKYLLTTLAAKCVEYIGNNLNEETVCVTLQLSSLFEEADLRKKCLLYIQKNTKKVTESDSFLQLNQKTLLDILQQDVLYMKEEELLTACLEWAAHQCDEQDIQATPANLRTILGDALYHLRMPTVSLETLNGKVFGSGILTNQEENALAMYMNQSGLLEGHILPFPTQKRRRGLELQNVCELVKKTTMTTVMAGRWYTLPVNVSDDIYIHSISILDRIPSSYTVRVTVAIVQDENTLCQFAMSVPSTTKSNKLGSVLNMKPFKAIKVNKGDFSIKVSFKFVGGTYGTIPGGIPHNMEIDCHEAKFSFLPDSHSHVSAFHFTIAEDWESFTPDTKKMVEETASCA